MKRVVVLGAGLVGGVLARDLALDGSVELRIADRSEDALGRLGSLPRTELRPADLSDPARVRALARESDVVVSAVPGRLGRSVQRAVLEVGRPLADISFTPEDPLELDGLARERGIAAVVDCGVAPGLSNLLVGRTVEEMEEVESVLIFVGGLPVCRVWPHEYLAVFSPADVIEEYVRPSRIRENGEEVVRPALSDVERIDFPGVGTLEAFNTDGLRTLLKTIPARTLKEKTLRYPGHAERMRLLRETGFFETEPLEVEGVRVSPRALTERLLSRAWRLVEGEEEFTLLRVEVEGLRSGEHVRVSWDLLDRTDPETGHTSMARTTAFPCAIVARLLSEGRITEPGVHPPEHLGRDKDLADRILAELRRRGVKVDRREMRMS